MHNKKLFHPSWCIILFSHIVWVYFALGFSNKQPAHEYIITKILSCYYCWSVAIPFLFNLIFIFIHLTAKITWSTQFSKYFRNRCNLLSHDANRCKSVRIVILLEKYRMLASSFIRIFQVFDWIHTKTADHL